MIKTPLKFENNHTTVLGTTRCGKTYSIKHILNQSKKGVLFFNTQHEDMPTSYITADGHNTYDQIASLIKSGQKVNFKPSTQPIIRNMQLSYMISEMYNHNGLDCIFVIDEVHLFKERQVRDDLERIATAGLKFGMNCVFISQRGALVNNTLISQSTQRVFFRMEIEDLEYFRAKKLPVDVMMDKLNKKGDFSFVVLERGEMSEAFKV